MPTRTVTLPRLASATMVTGQLGAPRTGTKSAARVGDDPAGGGGRTAGRAGGGALGLSPPHATQRVILLAFMRVQAPHVQVDAWEGAAAAAAASIGRVATIASTASVAARSAAAFAGSKPGRVREIIDVPLERPRRFEVHTDPTFLQLRSRVRALIHDEAARNTGFADVLS